MTDHTKALADALEELMEWQVKHVKRWHNSAYDNASRALAAYRAAPSLTVGERAESLADFLANTLGFVGDVDDAAAEIVAFLAPQPAAQAEPVAWRGRTLAEDDWTLYWSNPGSAVEVVEPLYTAPPSHPPAQGVELPPLPEPDFSGDAVIEHGLYSADQMHAYARAAIAQAPATKEQP